MLQDGSRDLTVLLPVPPPAVPRIKQIRESIVSKARDLTKSSRSHSSCKPDVAWGSAPDLDRAIDANIEPAFVINGMKPATHVVHLCTKARQRIRFEINVAELDRA